MRRRRIGIMGDGSGCEKLLFRNYVAQQDKQSSCDVVDSDVHKIAYAGFLVEIQVSHWGLIV